MSDEPTFRKGDTVEWNSHGGTATGTVVRKLTEPCNIEGHRVAASQDNVEYLVETEDGSRAAHKRGRCASAERLAETIFPHSTVPTNTPHRIR